MSKNIKIHGLSDIGKVREENQDAFLLDKDAGFFLIADGMGGLESGAETAQFVVNKIKSYLTDSFISSIRDKNKLFSFFRKIITQVSKEVAETSDDKAGSTLLMAYIYDNKAIIANVGDSPAYLFRESKLKCLTKDHNLASLLVEQGKITPNEAKTHHLRNNLISYMGIRTGIIIHFTDIDLQKGDRLLLCTDGLTSMVEESIISTFLNKEPDVENLTKILINESNKAGGSDNITVVIMDID